MSIENNNDESMMKELPERKARTRRETCPRTPIATYQKD